MRVYNFSAGPCQFPLEVLKNIQKDFTNYKQTGMSVMEMSHRSKPYDDINNEAIALLRELLNINDSYEIFFLQGGASEQFLTIPLNLLGDGVADYAVTGYFSKKAYQTAKNAFKDQINLICSSENNNFTKLPSLEEHKPSKNSKYFYITSNNTVFGLRYNEFPKVDCPLICDMSSDIASAVVDINQFDIVYAGAQKNLGAAGVTVVIIKRELIEKSNPHLLCVPTQNYKSVLAAKGIFNTPSTLSVYTLLENMKYLKSIGGVAAIEKINRQKSKLIYDYIDSTDFYINNTAVENRSLTNVVFKTRSLELDKKFIKQAEENNLISLKGHNKAGGMRASMYNGMPLEGAQALLSFMKKFEGENK